MQVRLALLPLLILFAVFCQVKAANFTFDFGLPTQCDNFPVSWSGGTPPFQLIIAPEFGTPRKFDVPASSFSNGQGSFSAQIPFPSGQKFIASMSDATGFASGGISTVLTVGAAVGNNNCNTTEPTADFFFELNDALTQCRSYTFSGYDGAVQPVTIMGLVPGGNSFILSPPTGPTSFDWLADVAAGTSLMFMMTDSKGRTGGSSDVRVVAISNDATCLKGSPPIMSVSNAPSATASISSSSGQTPSSSPSTAPINDTTSAKKNDVGVIVGATLAGIFGIITVIVLALFLLRRRRHRSEEYDGVTSYGSSRRNARMGSVDLDPPLNMHDTPGQTPVVQPFPYTASNALQFSRLGSPSSQGLLSSNFQNPQQQQHQQQQPLDTQTHYTDLTNPFSAAPSFSEHSAFSNARPTPAVPPTVTASSGREIGATTSAGRQKAAMAGSTATRPTRFILHTDIEESIPDDEGEEVVELPPQYSERRPLPLASEGSEYSTAPSEPDSRLSTHPLEHRRGDSEVGLQPPIQPGPPSPMTPPGSGRPHNQS